MSKRIPIKSFMSIKGARKYWQLLSDGVLEILINRVNNPEEINSYDDARLSLLKEKALHTMFDERLKTLEGLFEKLGGIIRHRQQSEAEDSVDTLMSLQSTNDSEQSLMEFHTGLQENDELENLDLPPKDTPPDEMLKNVGDKLDRLYRAIADECKSVSPSEVKEYFGSRARLKDADNLFFTRKIDAMRNNCPLHKYSTDEEISTANKVFAENLRKLQDIYGFTEQETQYIAMFLVQCKNKLWGKRVEYPIMLALFGKQGYGKSELAKAFCRVINMEDEPHQYDVDNILGNFGTLDVGVKPAILLNEFGRGNIENVDALKRYIDGGFIAINRKFRDSLPVNVISSFILATNRDPAFLYGSEMTSRRIMIVSMDRCTFNGTLEDTHRCIEQMWTHITPNTLDKFGIDLKKVALTKASRDIEYAFIEFLTALESEQRQTMSMMRAGDTWSIKKFTERFSIKSRTTAEAFLNLEQYFEKRVSTKTTYFIATEQLRKLIGKLERGETDFDDDPTPPTTTPTPPRKDPPPPPPTGTDDPSSFKFNAEEWRMPVCDDIYSAPHGDVTEKTQFVVTGTYTDEYLDSNPDKFDRKGEHMIPTALVYESDTLSLDEQKQLAVSITKGEYRDNIMWVTESGGKSIHTLVRISKEDGEEIKKLDCMKEVWEAVGKKIYGDTAGKLDKACASIGRLSRLPNAIRDNGNKQTCLYVNKKATPFPLKFIMERIRFMQRVKAVEVKPLRECRDGIDDELTTLENYYNKNNGKWELVYNTLVGGETPPSGSNMIGGIRLLEKAGLPGLLERFHDICHKAHPSNIHKRV